MSFILELFDEFPFKKAPKVMALNSQTNFDKNAFRSVCRIPRGGGGLPYISYIGMCGAKGYRFLAFLV